MYTNLAISIYVSLVGTDPIKRFWTWWMKTRSLMNTIRQRQKNWLGHVLKSESLLRTVLEGRMEVTRTRGRQSDTMIDWMKSNDVEYEHIKKRAHDRKD